MRTGSVGDRRLPSRPVGAGGQRGPREGIYFMAGRAPPGMPMYPIAALVRLFHFSSNALSTASLSAPL